MKAGPLPTAGPMNVVVGNGLSRSSRGPGHRPFTAVTRVRISYGTPIKSMSYGSVGAAPDHFTKNLTKYELPEPRRTRADGLRGKFGLDAMIDHDPSTRPT